ncbi:helix-turn-helix domain-containing protein [Sulfitobacter sp. SK011]|uniref:helix-turn-helix domain-containing protein n=1 Tax=Sulfitobacter sp. SK011 TaxID=1389004 RepID=UPI000E0C910D|nr:helix-turn-helix transcriptional regulator [Sulfitobacter sp. SK011]AXI41775.1 XRE family transcriptional regulator [Sulfitobacter sp. SK011]
MQIGERLFSLRQKSGQSLQAVADAAGISKAHIWELEKGHSKNPSFDLVRNLATHFGVSIDALVGEEEEPGAEALQIERLHRGFENLSEGDRSVVEQMVKALKERSAKSG